MSDKEFTKTIACLMALVAIWAVGAGAVVGLHPLEMVRGLPAVALGAILVLHVYGAGRIVRRLYRWLIGAGPVGPKPYYGDRDPTNGPGGMY